MILRRNLLLGILAAGAAPAIVRAQSLMPVAPRIWVPPQQLLEPLSMAFAPDRGVWWCTWGESGTDRLVRMDRSGNVSVMVGPALP
jgi:hypothetical protein